MGGGNLWAQAVEDVGGEVGCEDGVGVEAVQGGQAVRAGEVLVLGAGEAERVGLVVGVDTLQVSLPRPAGQGPGVVTTTHCHNHSVHQDHVFRGEYDS